MYSLIFTTFLLTAFVITSTDRNYRLLKLRFQKDQKLKTHQKNYSSSTKFKGFPQTKLNEMLLSHNLWYLLSSGYLQLLEPKDSEKQSVGKNVTETNGKTSQRKNECFLKEIKKLQPLKPDEIDFVRYHSLDKMYTYLDSLHGKYPHIVNIETIGESFENRDIKLVKVSTGDVGTKTTISIVGGMNSNEWISPATVIYCIQQLVENPVNRYMLGKSDWFLIPFTNPDGYEHSYKKNKKWKKTRSYGSNNCTGVDLNKNVDYRCEFTSHNNSCSDFYAGTQTFSEQEAKALLELITGGVQIQLFVNINNYGQSLEFPLDNAKKFIQDSGDLQYLAEKASYAMYKYGGRKYAIKGFNSCGSEQWVRRQGVKYSFNLKLPFENKHNSELQVPEENILNIAQEVFVAFRELQRLLESIYSVTYDLISED